MADVSTYTDLVTPQHSDKPRFMAMLAAVAGAFVDQQNLLASLPAAFDIDQAIGAQLDAVGEWVGLARSVKVPIDNVYFAWDTAGVGWDEGAWKRPSDPAAGLVLLDDTSYRLLLRAKIGANHWDGSMEDSVSILQDIFLPSGLMPVLTDNQDMSMTISLSGYQISALSRALIVGGYIPVRPVGVEVDFVIHIYDLLLNGTFELDGSQTLDGIR
ncbi:DUF2612 domain-containing protein [Rhodanobacter glycinis]|uniref:DUF2612 domain-containing protein n=1 Tax=Rhodanobacter glycinis TaxID=582702 RepID=A0A5B9E2V9_9GAMM|nr:DUF2612 domain-containing protein [Rhodanobacter glycinis]QEE24596.1 DUF2612 domain-containing protein [Rhodanobacter glycinis]